MRPKYEPEQIREVKQIIKHMQRPDALLHEHRAAQVMQQLLDENLALERHCADQARYIHENWYKHHLKPVTGPDHQAPRYPPGGRP